MKDLMFRVSLGCEKFIEDDELYVRKSPCSEFEVSVWGTALDNPLQIEGYSNPAYRRVIGNFGCFFVDMSDDEAVKKAKGYSYELDTALNTVMDRNLGDKVVVITGSRLYSHLDDSVDLMLHNIKKIFKESVKGLTNKDGEVVIYWFTSPIEKALLQTYEHDSDWLGSCEYYDDAVLIK